MRFATTKRTKYNPETKTATRYIITIVDTDYGSCSVECPEDQYNEYDGIMFACAKIGSNLSLKFKSLYEMAYANYNEGAKTVLEYIASVVIGYDIKKAYTEYLREQAKEEVKTRTCKKCGKVCESVEDLQKHTNDVHEAAREHRHVHKEALRRIRNMDLENKINAEVQRILANRDSVTSEDEVAALREQNKALTEELDSLKLQISCMFDQSKTAAPEDVDSKTTAKTTTVKQPGSTKKSGAKKATTNKTNKTTKKTDKN